MATAPVLMAVTGGGVVDVRGADTWAFLQSLLAQDLEPLDDGGSAPSLLLSPQGRLVGVLRVLRVGRDAALLDTAPGVAPSVVETLQRFRIRVDVELTDLSPAWDVLTVRGAPLEPLLSTAGLGVPPATGRAAAFADGWLHRADWGATPGVDLVAPRATIDRARDALVAAGAIDDAAALDAERIATGIPLQGRDVDERTIPQEAFLERHAVSFTKGCFVGQELVCRIDSRGSSVPRYLRHVEVAGDAVPPTGAHVVVDGTERGVVTSAARRGDQVVALAMVQRAVEPPADAEVRWDAATVAARVLAIDAH
ncbi:MAG TPA: hypothetical protein VFZ83_05250 [Acidimicrobiia bacterium]|nr:hypothetical protein [Acidimicrobiia bacterium]